VRSGRLRELLQLEENTAHQIAVSLKNNGTEEIVIKGIKENYPQLSSLSWSDLMPDMKMMNESMGFMMYIVVGIILLALGFGIVNTMLMVILERVKEFGMLMAVGMSRASIFRMVVMESVFLSITGGAIGIGVALLITAITGKTGIDLSFWSDGLNSMGFDSIIYPWIGIDSVIVVTILVIITGITAAIYPAKKAIELNPSESLRIDM
jgi:ABC-type antimicrobial peptide transport system permease subunit